MTTPNGTRVYARTPEGTETDVTEGVQALYDHCVHSMDWGSGFLALEDAEGIIRVAQACGFLVPETAAAAFMDYAQSFGREGSSSQSNIICATCGERAVYKSTVWEEIPDDSIIPHGWRYGAKIRDAGWYHDGHEPNHPVTLWR